VDYKYHLQQLKVIAAQIGQARDEDECDMLAARAMLHIRLAMEAGATVKQVHGVWVRRNG